MARGSSGLEPATKQRIVMNVTLKRPSVFQSDLWSVQNTDSIILTCSSGF
jgi:hypothetical protein